MNYIKELLSIRLKLRGVGLYKEADILRVIIEDLFQIKIIDTENSYTYYDTPTR